jgi:flavorubredoxin
MEKITNDIYYIGVNDKNIDLFEAMFKVPNGVAYNSYIVVDEKIAVMDSVEADFKDEWLKSIESTLGERLPDFLVVLHMEPDHSANILSFIQKYPNAKIVGNNKTFIMIEEFFGKIPDDKKVVVADGDTLSLGKHSLKFVFAPFVHWPEVMLAYEESENILFSADAFGKFGALDSKDNWDDEARRYYYGIVGKFGPQVQKLLKSLSGVKINAICPLHGPVLKENLSHYLDLYNKWSSYSPEIDGVMIAYTSVYGHTKSAVEKLADMLEKKGCAVKIFDLTRADRSEAISNAFMYKKLVLATTTYNGGIFPNMREFLDCIAERNYQDRTVALIENGSWAPVASNGMKARLEKCKNITYTNTSVKIRSALNAESEAQLVALADELLK